MTVACKVLNMFLHLREGLVRVIHLQKVDIRIAGDLDQTLGYMFVS